MFTQRFKKAQNHQKNLSHKPETSAKQHGSFLHHKPLQCSSKKLIAKHLFKTKMTAGNTADDN